MDGDGWWWMVVEMGGGCLYVLSFLSSAINTDGVPTAFGSIEGVGSPSSSLPTHHSLTPASANLIITTGSHLRMADPSFPSFLPYVLRRLSFVLCFVESHSRDGTRMTRPEGDWRNKLRLPRLGPCLEKVVPLLGRGPRLPGALAPVGTCGGPCGGT
jgi:hypothetical protein